MLKCFEKKATSFEVAVLRQAVDAQGKLLTKLMFELSELKSDRLAAVESKADEALGRANRSANSLESTLEQMQPLNVLKMMLEALHQAVQRHEELIAVACGTYSPPVAASACCDVVSDFHSNEDGPT